MLSSYVVCFQLSPGDLSLLPGKLGQAASSPKFTTAEEEGSSRKLEGGCWMSLQQYRAHDLPPGSLPRHFSSKELWQELLHVPLRLKLKQNNSAMQKPRGWDAGDLLLMCQQGSICHMHLCCFCRIKTWNNLKRPPFFGDKLKKEEIFLH